MIELRCSSTRETCSHAIAAQRADAMTGKIKQFGLSDNARIVATVLVEKADAAGAVEATPWTLAPVAKISPKAACKALIELECYDIIERKFGGPERYKILPGWREASA